MTDTPIRQMLDTMCRAAERADGDTDRALSQKRSRIEAGIAAGVGDLTDREAAILLRMNGVLVDERL